VLAGLSLALLLLPVSLAGEVEMRRVRVYDGHASLEIPSDWAELPTEVLDFLTLRAAEVSGGLTTETYQHGFRQGDPESGFELPQILIQIREDGRLPLSRFVNLPTPDEVEAESRDLVRPGRAPFLQGLALDRVSFDADRRVLRVDSTMELLVEGTTAVRSASFLTERGTFVVHCYDHASRMASSRLLFDRIIASVQFDDEIGYRLRWNDRFTNRHRLVLLLAAAALAVLIVALVRRWRLARPGGPSLE
jgi:hypothetical protein